jgi:DNA-binding MarR family transcriptional regulator
MASDTASSSQPRGCTNLKLRQLSRRVSRLYDEAMEATGLKGTQYSLLSHVILMEPVRPSDLAARMTLDASTLTRNLQPLVAQGWVLIGEGEDGRSRLVTSTQAGRAKRQQGQRAWKQA